MPATRSVRPLLLGALLCTLGTAGWGTSPLALAAEASPGAKVETTETKAQLAAKSAMEFLKRLEGTSLLIEHAHSVGHHQDLSPSYTRSFVRTIAFEPAYAISEDLATTLRLAGSQELTTTDTTYRQEFLWEDLQLTAELTLPVPEKAQGIFAAGLAAAVDFPTSKASEAQTQVLALAPAVDFAVTAPLLDGLSWAYSIEASPRFFRYTTASTQVPLPCSVTAGCALGRTTNTGQRNTAFLLTHSFEVSLAALDSKLGLSASLDLSYGFLTEKSPSERWEETTLSPAENAGGSPVNLSSAFVFDPGVGLSIGLWTPAGMEADGSYTNPVANRYSQVYVDVTLSPVAGLLAEIKRDRERR